MNKEVVLKLKLLALDELKYSPMTDVRGFRPSEKRKLLALIEAKFASMTPAEIDEAFNQLVCEDVLSAKADVSKYHVNVFAEENISA